MAADLTNSAHRRAHRTSWGADARSRWRASSVVCASGLGGAVALLAFAHGVAAWSGDPGERAPTFATLGIVVVSLSVLSWSGWGLVESNQSLWRHVFHSRRSALSAGALTVVAGALIASLVMRDPFRGFFASGRITAYELVDVGCILGAVVSLTLAAAAAVAAWDAFQDERHWGRSLGIGS
jgi:hypothetical protein